MSDAALLLRVWLKRCRESSLAHYKVSEIYSRYNLFLGVPATVFSAIVGTAVFSSLGDGQVIDLKIKIAVGFVSVLTTVLAALQTFLRFAERSQAHLTAATKYGVIRRQIEQQLTFPDKIDAEVVTKIREELDATSFSSPNVSAALWRKVLSGIDQNYFMSPTA